MESSKRIDIVMFHGGCHGCSQQVKTNSYAACKRCRYLGANWSLPNMNNEPASKADLIRSQLLNGG